MLGVNVNKTEQRSPESFWNIPNASPLRTELFLQFFMHKSEYERGFPTGFLEVIRNADSVKKKEHYMDWYGEKWSCYIVKWTKMMVLTFIQNKIELKQKQQ